MIRFGALVHGFLSCFVVFSFWQLESVSAEVKTSMRRSVTQGKKINGKALASQVMRDRKSVKSNSRKLASETKESFQSKRLGEEESNQDLESIETKDGKKHQGKVDLQVKGVTESKSALAMSLGTRYLSYDVRETTYGERVELNTNINPAVALQYQRSWSSRLHSVLKVFGVFYSFSDLPPSYSIEGKSGNLIGIGFDTSYHFDRWKPYLGINASQELFFRSSVAKIYQVHRAWVIQPHVGIDFDAFRFSGLVLGLGVQGQYLLPSQSSGFDIKSGYRLGGSVYGVKSLRSDERLNLKVLGFYGVDSQGSQFATQQGRRFYFDLTLHYAF